jgi:hypothetical protein
MYKYTISINCSTTESQGNSTGNLHENRGGLPKSSPFRSDGSQDSQVGRLENVSGGQRQFKGGPSGASPLRSDGSHDGQAERLDRINSGQKTLKAKLNFKRDYQVRVHSGQMVLMVVRQGGLCCLSSGPRHSKDSQKMTLGSQLKEGQSDCPKKSQLTLFSIF